MGNLTLITVPGNTTASNGYFTAKKLWLKKILLALNLEIIDLPKWDEDEITLRGKILADLAVKIWPSPDAVTRCQYEWR